VVITHELLGDAAPQPTDTAAKKMRSRNANEGFRGMVKPSFSEFKSVPWPDEMKKKAPGLSDAIE
jgi:hypothetical protein